MDTKKLTFAITMGALGSALFAISYTTGQIAPGIALDLSLIAVVIAGIYGGPTIGFIAGLIAGLLPGIMFGPLGMGGAAGLIGLPLGKGLSGMTAGLIAKGLKLGQKQRSSLLGIPTCYLSYIPEGLFTYAYFIFIMGGLSGGDIYIFSILPKALVEVTVTSVIITALMGNVGFNNFVKAHFTKTATNKISSQRN
jgi:LytS/YehU family sensor histidine kinase